MTGGYFAGAFNANDLEHAKRIVLTPDTSRPGKFSEETDFLVDFLMSHHLLGPRRTVLDFGCGMGRISKKIVETRDCDVIGVDISPSMRMFAREYVGNPSRFKVVHLYVEPSSIDLVISAFTLQHVENPESEIRTLKEVLKSGGFFALLDEGKRFVPSDVDTEGFVVWEDDGISILELMRDSFACLGTFPYCDGRKNVLSLWQKT